MKTVVVHGNAKQVEKDWAKQFAGLDPDVVKQFATAVDWTARTQKIFTISSPTWESIVTAVSDAAKAAGAGGVVIIASGHGGVVPNDLDAGIINWDASDSNVDRAWTAEKIGKGLFWDEVIAQYTDPIPFSKPPTQKEIDEENIKNGVKTANILQKRQEAFAALQKVGTALKSNGVARLTFTVCTAGAATRFMDRLAKHCRTQVACFKTTTMVLDDATFGAKPPKSRLILERDSAKDGKGTNVPSARVFSPDLDDNRIAYVANP